MPTIKATKDFQANTIGLLDGDQYTNSGTLKFQSTNVFFRQVRNIIFDTTDVPGPICAVHWPSSQATSIQNCVFKLSQDPDLQHVGIFMEEGSGGFLNDLVFYGGTYGAQFGNQQYTLRNLTFFNSQTAILQIWNWGFTYKNINTYNCSVGINMTGPVIGSVALLDSTFSDTRVGIATGRAPATQTAPGAGSLIVENVAFTNVQDVISGPSGSIVTGNSSGTILKKGYAYVRRTRLRPLTLYNHY
jgi:glucan 1,3-beta-glucosidase